MKLSDKNEIKRLAIYFFYDKDGIVDDYIPYMLEDLNKNISELLVVCNGKLTPESRSKLEKYTSNILVRENKGFDVWAYKEGIETYGWDKLSTFDEVIFMNFTIMGPLYPFKEMFDDMDKRDLDFWGITAFHSAPFDPFGTIKYNYLPLHIQSHFIVVRNKMLNSIEFKRYWDNMPMVTRYEEAIGFHEAIFTKEFEDKGYRWDVYVNTEDLYKHSYGPIIMSPLDLVKNRRCPIIKRRSFFHNYNDFLAFNNGESSIEMMNYISQNTNYDINLIWDNILRVQNQADIKKCLHLNYILSSNIYENENIKNIDKKVALVLHIYFEDLIEYCFNYAKSMPNSSDIYVTTDTEQKRKSILKVFSKLNCNKLEVIVIENRGRDVSALLVGTKDFIMNYDYVCFAHDKKVGQLDFSIKGEAFSYKCFENVLKNNIYVENIINVFEKNPRVGLLTPPPPNHAEYYPTLSYVDWEHNFNNTVKLAKELNVNVDFNCKKESIAPLGTMFWFRPVALKKLFERNWKYSDFPSEPNNTDGTLLHAIERVYPYVVQDEGFYPAWIMVDTFAKIEITNLSYMLRELNDVAFELYGNNSFNGLVSTMRYALDQNQNEMQTDKIIRKFIKEKIKRKVPKFIWRVVKKIYHMFPGKRWVG
ncbi:rhamnan synthesis F family protein [Clostridium saccharoperbutylacetonicum]|uniref:rhamnan synthesis F family protein n=1 Tax=Clostridium saccharoperbutylacetonicum TaxID=36745 RepID=UPI000983ABF4|nr:rhamnan synthesis F family protein [Clostridium saccharoperbutylacetonicum]AQR97835.1 rhamnan synthesis protein F [Clostridium saccharoperbutylacetonicum]NSB33727.1 rhamnosyltransferase [Clostridium saccharoperbutylacetonicum]